MSHVLLGLLLLVLHQEIVNDVKEAFSFSVLQAGAGEDCCPGVLLSIL